MRIIGVAFYRREQWVDLRSLSTDPDKIEDTYEAWLKSAEDAVVNMRKMGAEVRKVPVDVWKMYLWSRKQKIPFNGAARARYVTEKMESENE